MLEVHCLKFNTSRLIRLENPPLMDEWHRQRTPIRDQTYRQIGLNIVEAKKTLPLTSTVNTALLKYTSNGTVPIFQMCAYSQA